MGKVIKYNNTYEKNTVKLEASRPKINNYNSIKQHYSRIYNKSKDNITNTEEIVHIFEPYKFAVKSAYNSLKN